MFAGWAPLLALAAASPGGTAGPGSWLSVQAEAGARSCPTAAVLAAAVEAELGRPPFAAHRGPARVRCRLARARDGWRADIEIGRDPQAPAVRTIRSSGTSCNQLASAVVLTLSLALSSEPPTPASAPPARVRQQADAEIPSGLLAARAETPATTRWGLSGGAVVSAGALPELAAGLELGARWRRGRLVLALEGRAERARARVTDPVVIQGSRLAAALVPCFAPGWFEGCLVLRGGAVAARGERLAVTRAVQGLLAETGARVVWQLGGSGAGVALYAELTTPLVRTRLLVDGRPLWQAPPAVASFGLALLTSR